MPEILEKLTPHRDLQCYFERPSAIAALSEATATGFKVSGTWRQQYDWAVIEWNRDNTFEHPLFRCLPDGDLRGLQLNYEETRTNCIALDADWYWTVDWPYLRVWVGNTVHKVALRDHATPVEGSYVAAAVEFELSGTPTTGDYVGLAWLSEHHVHQLYGTDTIESALQAIVDSVNAFSQTMTASRTGNRIRLTRQGDAGANGNRVGVYSLVSGAGTESWDQPWKTLSGGASPTKWRIDLDFGNLWDIERQRVPTEDVRKLRWTYAADIQPDNFIRSEFAVQVTNWNVTGTGRGCRVAGQGSRRIEDDAREAAYSGVWREEKGNYSGGTIRYADVAGASLTCCYRSAGNHELYLGTRLVPDGATVSVTVDGSPLVTRDLCAPGEDWLLRLPLGAYGAGEHTVVASHSGASGQKLWIDFLEIAVPASAVPEPEEEPGITLATDWDTDHSISLAPERTAWMMYSLGFRGRANHYVGAMWFYELEQPGAGHASGWVDFTSPQPNQITKLLLGGTSLEHLNLIGDSPATVAKVFEFEINRGSTGVWASANEGRLSIHARAAGTVGNAITMGVEPAGAGTTSGTALSGGVDAEWRTDLTASPRLNRAARDWTRSFFAALKGYGIDGAAAFSLELQHGDPSPAAGIAQRYPNGNAALLNTPALQTNFSPASAAYWKQVYRDMANVQAEAGCRPFLQFGEVQWWYFPSDGSGMPFYDEYTKETFRTRYGRDLRTITSNLANPSLYPEECEFLPSLIGAFTAEVMSFVREAQADCRFEVLYPNDVNESSLNTRINYPLNDWTDEKLDCLKTESFTYTYARNLDQAKKSIASSGIRGFAPNKRSHLVGISDATTAWWKEARDARGEGLESVVLFALDQFCLVGYEVPLPGSLRRSVFFAG